MPKENNVLEFRLLGSDASHKARKALDYAMMSGKASSVSNWEVLEKLIDLLEQPKFANYKIHFVRYDKINNETKVVEYDLEMIKICLRDGIECRPL